MWGLIRGGLIAGNGIGLLVTALLIWDALSSYSRPHWDDAAFGALLLTALFLNLYFLIFRTVKGSDWLSLWMKRKRLEEEKRIKDLEEQVQG